MGEPEGTRQPTKSRGRNAAQTRLNILGVAIKEFADHGLSGARVDEIAAKTHTSKRMIYYYFGDKEGLFVAALEKAYADVRAKESALDLSTVPPRAALERLVRFTFDHHAANPDFIRLIMVTNIHGAQHITQSERIRDINLSAVSTLDDIRQRGIDAGLFTPDVTALDLHWQISALSFFNVSNRPTFTALFGDEYGTTRHDHLRDLAVKSVLSVATGV